MDINSIRNCTHDVFYIKSEFYRTFGINLNEIKINFFHMRSRTRKENEEETTMLHKKYQGIIL